MLRKTFRCCRRIPKLCGKENLLEPCITMVTVVYSAIARHCQGQFRNSSILLRFCRLFTRKERQQRLACVMLPSLSACLRIPNYLYPRNNQNRREDWFWEQLTVSEWASVTVTNTLFQERRGKSSSILLACWKFHHPGCRYAQKIRQHTHHPSLADQAAHPQAYQPTDDLRETSFYLWWRNTR
jgi:hypothetical protein